MLFRAHGLSHVKSQATPINLTEQLRADSKKGFQSAEEEFIVGLKGQLALFKKNIKESGR